MKKIILGKQYKLDMGQQVTVIPRRVLTEGIECDYVMSSPGRKELIRFNIWEMNGFDVSDYSLMWMDSEFDTGRTKPEPKFKVGDKVLVCDELKTEITNVEYENGEWKYYFKDENNNNKCENEYAIDFIKESMFNPFQTNINAINETVDYINFNVESEAVRLISSHYKLQTGNWNWIYSNQVDKKSWEMAKQHASNTAEENVKQSVINKLDNKIIDFWFDVIRRIEKL